MRFPLRIGVLPAALLLFAASAQAQEISGNFAEGSVKIGNDAAACDAARAGAVRYSGGALGLCDGSNWTAVGGGSSQWIASGSDIYYGTGKVGIGGSVFYDNAVLAVTTGNQQVSAGFDGGLTGAKSRFLIRHPADDLVDLAADQVTGQLSFSVNADERMRITSAGKVGIGTTSPTSALQVETPVTLGSNVDALTIVGTNGGNPTVDTTVGLNFNLRAPSPGSNWTYGAIRAGEGLGTGQVMGSLRFLTQKYNSGSVLVERMRIDHNGNVGIGTTSPGATLHVKGGEIRSEATANPFYRLLQTGDADDAFIALANDSGEWPALSMTAAQGTNVAAQDMILASGKIDGKIVFAGRAASESKWSPRFVFQGNGNVGIGTTSPSYPLEVTGSPAYTNYVVAGLGNSYVGSAASASSWVKLYGTTTGTGDSSFAYGTQSGNFYLNYLGARATAPSSGTNLMTVQSTGKVGIGTTSPQARLHVSSPALTTFTGGTMGAAVIDAPYGSGDQYSALDFTFDNATIPVARIAMRSNGGGSYLQLGTSSNYSTGVTNTAMTIGPWGHTGIGTTAPGARLDVRQDQAGTTPVGTTSGLNITNLDTTAGAGNALRFVGATSTGTAYPSAQITAFSTPGSGIVTSSKLAFSTVSAGSFNQAMTIDSGGNVGIGTTAPGAQLDINGSQVFSSSRNFKVRSTAGGSLTNMEMAGLAEVAGAGTWVAVYGKQGSGSYAAYFDGAGYLNAGAWTYSSDRRLKRNINYFGEGLKTIRALKPARFDYREGEQHQVGFIAQDVQGVIPEAVSVTNSETQMLGLKTEFITPFLVNAVKELADENQSLRDANAALEKRLNAIEAQLAAD